MLVQVCLLLLSVGVYALYAESSSESTTEDDLFGELDFIFPENFLSKFPQESEFFTVKIFVYLFFNLFAKYLGENEPIKFWSKFNHDDFNRVAIDAAFYEYLTKFADRKMKHLVFNPLESSPSSPEDIAIDRIGDYLDNLSADEVPTDQSETRSQATKNEDYEYHNAKISVPTPTSGIPGKDFPNYDDIPKTSFTCENKLVPGIYADTETGCQVFHTCWPHRIDSYLCPIGTTFNQALLTCDFWHESDCLSSPLLFDHSVFAKGTTPRNTEPTIAMDDEIKTTSECPTAFTSELDIPEYDGTCQSLFSKPLQLHMKFLPAKCKVTDLKPSAPEPTSKLSKSEDKRFDRLMANLLAGDFGKMFAFMIKAAELESGMQAAQLPELKVKWSTPELDSKVVKEATESPQKNGDVDATSEEQIRTSTTEFPSDNQEKFPPQMNSRFVEKSVFKATSQGKVKHWRTVSKSTLLKQSKPSEDTIKQVFDTMSTSMKLGGKILTDGLLPLVEKIVMDSHDKKSSKS